MGIKVMKDIDKWLLTTITGILLMVIGFLCQRTYTTVIDLELKVNQLNVQMEELRSKWMTREQIILLIHEEIQKGKK